VENLSLQLKHESAIKVRVSYKDPNGDTKYHEVSTSFDADEQAEIQAGEWTVEADGSLRYSLTGDEDTAQIIANITVNSGPTTVTQANKELTVTGNRGDGDTGIDLNWDDYAYISVGACSTAGGTPDTYQTYFVRRVVGEITKTVRLAPTGLALANVGSSVAAYGGAVIAGTAASNSFKIPMGKVPQGATIDQIVIRYYREDASSVISSAVLYRESSSSATPNTVYTFSGFTTTGSYASATYAGDHTVDGAYQYYFHFTVSPNTNPQDVRIHYIEITYISHDVDETL